MKARVIIDGKTLLATPENIELLHRRSAEAFHEKILRKESMSIVTDLQEARELILKEENWTQEAFARDAQDYVVHTIQPEACKFCALGALRKVAKYTGPDDSANTFRYDQLREKLAAGSFEVDHLGGIVHVNDTLGHEATITMYDKAIALAKGQT